ncbi:MAG: TetR/AcrR family transcriptional regulator [Candidatus Krumholzibacteria bacterium]|nr:TetR/AcrR family transcriptional regulator [Candidatus Krumholzibacteria bacterium]
MKERNLSRKEKERLWRRRHMLSSALELFAEKGYHNISMHKIAKKAEFAIGTLYKFFRNKEDLYKALVTEMATDYNRILTEVLAGEEDTLTVIRSYISVKSDFFADRITSLRLYLAETRGASFNIAAGLDRDMLKLYNELVERLAAVMEVGIKRNVLRRMDPYYMAISLEGITNAFLFCWLENPERHSYEENIPMISELFLKGSMAE